MNLRTFTLREMFLWIFFCKHRGAVMFDARKAVHLTGHEYEFEQIAFDFGDQLGHAFDHLTGEVLIILGQQNVVEIARHRTVARVAARQKTVDPARQFAELFSPDFAAHETAPIRAQSLGFFSQTIDHRRGAFHQIHGAVGRSFRQLDHIAQTFGGVGDLRHFLGLRHVRIDLEIDDRTVQFACELAHFLIQAAVTGLIELMDQLHSVAELAFFKALDQFDRVFFQGRLEIAL